MTYRSQQNTTKISTILVTANSTRRPHTLLRRQSSFPTTRQSCCMVALDRFIPYTVENSLNSSAVLDLGFIRPCTLAPNCCCTATTIIAGRCVGSRSLGHSHSVLGTETPLVSNSNLRDYASLRSSVPFAVGHANDRHYS